jgi:CRISPR-associated protein (TIGR02584 family)
MSSRPRKIISERGSTPRTRSPADSLNAASSPEVILLVVTGMSPAILTETIWALAQEEPKVLPDRIVVVTTGAGKEQIIQELFTTKPWFSSQSGWDCLLQALETAGHDTASRLRFDPYSDDVRLITRWEARSRRRKILSDIRSRADNEAVADFILDVARSIVENPDTQLIASVAGGRKTMGTLLYACMTLIGRETDRITHVLVDEPFDDPKLEPKFYFPGQPAAELTTFQRQRVCAVDAQIVLADLPFVPLRNLFRKELGQMPGAFMTLVDRCSNEVRRRTAANVELVIHRSKTVIEVSGISINLSAREHILVLFLTFRLHQGHPPFRSYKDGVDSLNEYREQLKSSAPAERMSDWRWGLGHSSTFDDHDIRRAVSRLRKELRRTSPEAMTLIDRFPQPGRLSIDLPGTQIRIVD